MRRTIVFCVLLAACTSNKKISETLNSWVGADKHTLVQQWGPPTQTTSDGSTGEILVYANRVYYNMPNGAPVDYWVYKMMYVDSGGKIYHWLYRKNPNPPERIDVRLLSK